jgi:hypothetical protein
MRLCKLFALPFAMRQRHADFLRHDIALHLREWEPQRLAKQQRLPLGEPHRQRNGEREPLGVGKPLQQRNRQRVSLRLLLLLCELHGHPLPLPLRLLVCLRHRVADALHVRERLRHGLGYLQPVRERERLPLRLPHH